jgi:hypothetical protein
VQPGHPEPPLEVNRAATHWNIYLPLGSSEGPYDVRVVTQSGESILAASSTAKLADQITSLKAAVRLSSMRSGRYILQLPGRGLVEWNSYALISAEQTGTSVHARKYLRRHNKDLSKHWDPFVLKGSDTRC